jgi:iron(III) transport system substrate-binding protein
VIFTRSYLRRKKFSRSLWVDLVISATLFAITSQSRSAASRPTAAELPLYQGPDREKIILEGARKEGQLVFYNSHTWFKSVAQEFEKKYPSVKVSEWRAEGPDVLKRVLEESRAGRNRADVVESTEANIAGLHKKELLQEHHSPEIRFYDGEVLAKGKRGVYYWADR